MFRCPACFRKSAGPVFCGFCAAKVTVCKPPTAEAEALLRQYDKRWESLHGMGASSSGNRNGLWTRFQKFLTDVCGQPQVLAATPMDVIYFFMHSDAGGNTVVHSKSCLFWQRSSRKSDAPCACATRAAATTVNTNRGVLQGLFRDMGLTSPWNPLAQAGNPVDAAVVDEYVKRSAQEQFAAGVRRHKAALISTAVFEALISEFLRLQLVASSRGRTPDAIAAVSAALHLSFCWHTGLRAKDACRVLLQQLVFDNEGSPTKVDVTVTVTKTRFDQRCTRKLCIVRDDSVGCFISLFQRYRRLLQAIRAPPFTAGHMFCTLNRVKFGAGPYCWSYGGETPVSTVAARFRRSVLQLGLTKSITMHSPHGSFAANDRAAGIPPLTTCKRMDWTLATYHEYLDDRQPIGLNEARALFAAEKVALLSKRA